jgi:hypothetical protein
MRLGEPQYVCERGTVTEESASYVRRWTWPCGCDGEVIGGTLIELRRCRSHER